MYKCIHHSYIYITSKFLLVKELINTYSAYNVIVCCYRAVRHYISGRMSI